MDIVLKSLKSLEYDKILERVSMLAKLEQSRQLCCNALPLNDEEKIREALEFTREAKAVLDSSADIPVEFVADMKKIRHSTLTGYLSEEELVNTAKTIRTSRLVKNFLTSGKLSELAQTLFASRKLEDEIFAVFDENLHIKPDATPELKRLHAALRDNENNLKAKVTELLNSPDFSKHLQENIYTTRDDRIVFQVMASSKSKVPGIVHDVSATNKTFYIEPQQLVPLNNRIREVKSLIHAEIVRLLIYLTGLVKENITQIIKSEETLALIDFHFAKARYAIRIHAVEPEIIADELVEFENMRHPLLENDVVANDFTIGNDYKSVIITGSNTGGKTVTLKTVGLFLLMAKTGIFLPCTAAKIYPFEKILCDIGDDQSILQNLSTFSSHMTNIIEILRRSDKNTFVLLDEICAGTDPHEGAVLAQVILESLATKHVFSVVTTHYGELKALEYSNPYFKNASVEFDTTTLKPTYKLLIGIPGLSHAIAVAQNLGLNSVLVEKARSLLHTDLSVLAVEKLNETRTKLSKNLEQAEIMREDSEIIKKEYEETLAKARHNKNKTVKIIKDKFDRELLSVKSEIKDILEELRHDKSEKTVRRSYARLIQLERGFRDKLNEYEEKPEYAALDRSRIKIGDSLILKDFDRPVKVLSLPDKNDNITVQMGDFTAKIKTDRLAPCD